MRLFTLLHWWVGAFEVSTCAAAATVTSYPSPTRHIEVRRPLVSNACSLAARASASYVADFPSASSIEIPADVALNCLRSIPNKPKPALDLLNALRSWIEFQSDKDTYLVNPPEGYLFPGVDIDKYVEGIRHNIKTGNYDSEYDFQIDIQAMMIDAKDGHFIYNGDATGLFVFKRTIDLAAVSVDGIQHPHVYILNDLVQPVGDGSQLGPVVDYSPSQVTEINGIDVVSFLLSQSLVGLSQDPDALYNQNFFQLAREVANEPSNFEYPLFYPGLDTNITLANGTVLVYPNIALVEIDLTGINTGEDMYEAYCNPVDAAVTSAVPSSTMAKRADSTPTSATLPFYPWPVIKHSANVVSGYYLNETGLKDVAVLAINSFEPPNDGGELEFQDIVQAFLGAAVQSGKKKLVVDLQGNGGGFIDLGLDLFAQLFPSIKPDVKSNMRASLGMELLAQSASLLLEENVNNETAEEIDVATFTPFAFQSIMTPDAKNFPSLESFYGPVTRDGGNFTNFFQNNYTDEHQSDLFGEGIVITGTNNRTDFTQPFAAQDIILLHDGFCASTCTLFSEFMKNYANVQSITVGGRPQDGPMQGVGGIKGAQIFTFDTFPYWVNIFYSAEDVNLDDVAGTVFENFTDLPFSRSYQSNPGGVNGRNNFRVGDETLTPLQYVYEASDCRLWWTQEMLYDPTFLWNRVAELAFHNRTGTQFSSPYCVNGSTGHPTSVSGGWKQGTLGPQTPPENAKMTTEGWIVNGDTIQNYGPAGEHIPPEADNSNTTDDGPGDTGVHKSQAITEACGHYTGNSWLVKVVCAVLSY